MPSLIEYFPGALFPQFGLPEGGELDAPLVESDPCGCPPASSVDLERTRFFPRQLVGPDELTADQLYFRAKHRRHNRLLHGWGVVCGARVMADPDVDCGVIVEPGYVLGPWGDEIVIPHRVKVDLCKQDLNGDAVSPCGGDVDPWCTDVRTSRPDDKPLYVAVKFAECDTRPVRTIGCGCGCDDSECEYSRIRDSYSIRVLTELPSSHERMTPLASVYGMLWGVACLGGKGRGCPPCPAEPWVVLADVQLSAGKVSNIDCFAHRRYVGSAAMFYFLCGDRRGAIDREKSYRPVGHTFVDATMLSTDAEPDAPPPATVAIRLGTSWSSIPAHFEVKEGDTVGSLLEREGDREFINPETADAFTLRELYAAAAVDPATPIGTRGEALVELEGQTLDIAGMRAVRRSLDEVIGPEGAKRLDEELGGSPERSVDLPAAVLSAPAGDEALAKAIGDATVGDVAGVERGTFIARVARRADKESRPRLQARAAEVWTAATRAVRLAESWRASEPVAEVPDETEGESAR